MQGMRQKFGSAGAGIPCYVQCHVYYLGTVTYFFDQVGHETMYASSGNKHFFTKSCHRQTYQNCEQSR